MALFVLFDNQAEDTMNTHMTTSPDESARPPESVGDCDEQADTRQMTPEAEERVPDEAGYGYGV